MPRLRNTKHIIDLVDSSLSLSMMIRLHNLTGSCVINLLNTKLIYHITYEISSLTRDTATCSIEIHFGYVDNLLYRYFDGIIMGSTRPPRADGGNLLGISWHLVTDIQLEDDKLVCYA